MLSNGTMGSKLPKISPKVRKKRFGFVNPIKEYSYKHRERAVFIINLTGDNIYVRCTSGSTKVVDQYLENESSISWKFKPNILLSTVYWCDITYKDVCKGFDAWRSDRAGWQDDVLSWTVRDSQIVSSRGEVEDWFFFNCQTLTPISRR